MLCMVTADPGWGQRWGDGAEGRVSSRALPPAPCGVWSWLGLSAQMSAVLFLHLRDGAGRFRGDVKVRRGHLSRGGRGGEEGER